MNIDERSAACVADIVDNAIRTTGREASATVIARHIREAVAERDELLRECEEVLYDNNIGESLRTRITAIIGGHDDA